MIIHTRTLLYHMTAQRRPHTHNGTCTHASRAQQALDWRPLLPLSLSFSYHHHISLHHRHNHPMAALRRTSQRFPPPAWLAAADSRPSHLCRRLSQRLRHRTSHRSVARCRPIGSQSRLSQACSTSRSSMAAPLRRQTPALQVRGRGGKHSATDC